MAGMVVQHNLNAINANNKMNMNVSGTKKATEKLSSGYAINRAGDNAAGLAISEKMRAQTRGLKQAVNNANDGISLIQTAEGGLNETHSILQRMRELAVQSANGTYQQEDRDAMQLEVDALKSEIDRISDSTEYNGIKLLDGSLSGTGGLNGTYGPRYGEKIVAGQTGEFDGTITSNMTGVKVGIFANTATKGGENATWDATGMELSINLAEGVTYTQSQIDEIVKNASTMTDGDQTNNKASVKINLDSGVLKADSNLLTGAMTTGTVAGVRASSDDGAGGSDGNLAGYLANATSTEGYANSISLTSNSYGGDQRKVSIYTDAEKGKESVSVDNSNSVVPGTDPQTGDKMGEYVLHLSTGVEYSEKDIQNILSKAGIDMEVKLYDSAAAAPDGDKKFYANTMNDATNGSPIQLDLAGGVTGAGVSKDEVNATGKGLTFQIGANGVEDQRVTLNVDDMDSTALGVSGINVKDQDDANAGIDKIDSAINGVSMQRAGLGALQNRLEYTVNNLTTTNENLTAAESQIRDTDMASEMINYTKFNILQQASQAMLAQANQAPQAVLQLLG